MEQLLTVLLKSPVLWLALLSIVIFDRLLSIKKRASYKYKPVKYLNTKSEQNFFNQAIKVIPDSYYLVCKVRLADICLPRKSNNISAFNKVAQKHCDFVVVSKKNSEIKCVIELDDTSHLTKGAMKRDAEKNRALKSAGVPLFRIKTTRSYDLTELRTYLSEGHEARVNASKLVGCEGKPCPRCKTGILDRVDMKWPNKGSYFFECQEGVCKYKTEIMKVEK